MKKVALSVSIVTYRTPQLMLETAWRTLNEACCRLEGGGRTCELKLMIVDNTDPPDVALEAFRRRHSAAPIELRAGHGNIGYGAAHNLAIESVDSDYHLVLNPDVELDCDAIVNAVDFMQAYPECGLLAPAVFDERGHQQFLCRRYPAVWDFFLRGFAPLWLAKRFQRRLDRYEMRDVIGQSVHWDPSVISGCFMFFRTKLLKRMGGFDRRFFLYLEDFDLTLRTSRIARVAYVPGVKIVHHGGDAARKGLWHIGTFMASAVKFYTKNGWRWI